MKPSISQKPLEYNEVNCAHVMAEAIWQRSCKFEFKVKCQKETKERCRLLRLNFED